MVELIEKKISDGIELIRQLGEEGKARRELKNNTRTGNPVPFARQIVKDEKNPTKE